MSRYVGIGLHRRRSVVVIMDQDGTRVSLRRIANSPFVSEAVADAGPDPEVVFEATWGWYWALPPVRLEYCPDDDSKPGKDPDPNRVLGDGEHHNTEAGPDDDAKSDKRSVATAFFRVLWI